MKTGKTSAKKKDWQKVDARVLGQILAAQNVDFVLPDSTHIAEFFAETLITIPGIEACRVCLREVSVQRGKMGDGVCESCEASRGKPGSKQETSSFEPGFKCGLVGQPGVQFSAIASPIHHFGFFVFQVNDLDTFNVYKPFIDNLANYVALSLENRQQKDLLQKARDELEFRVAERTEELRASNEAIKDLYNNSPCGYHSLDKDGFFILINDTELRWLGYSRDEIVGKVTFRSLLSENSLKTFDANFSGFKERGWVSDLEFEMVRKDGSILPVLLNATAITDSDGNYVMSRSTTFDITERKRTEEALANTHLRLEQALRFTEALLSAIPTPVFYKDREGRYLGCNRAFSEIMGVTPEEIKGKTVFELWPSEHATVYHEKDLGLISNPTRQVYEFKVHDKNGIERPVIYVKDVFRDETDQVAGIVGAFLDITGRKQAEEALRESEERYRLLFHRSPVGVFHYNTQLHITDCNDRFVAILQSSRERLVGLDMKTLQDRSALSALHQATEGEEGFYEGLYRATTSSAKIQIFLRTAPLIDPQGKIAGCIGMVEDITKRKQAEEALRESEERFRRLAENAPDVIYRMSLPDGKYEYISPASLPIFGYAPEEYYDNPMLFRQAMHADWQKYFEEQWANLLKGEMSPTYEYQIIHKSGEIRWLNQRNILVCDSAGNPTAIEGIVTDITERKRAEEALRESEERYRLLVDLSPDAIGVHSEERIEFANPAMVQLHGARSEADIVGRSVLDFISPESRELVKKRIEETRVTGKSIPFVEEKFLRLDGTSVDVEVTSTSYTSQGKPYIQVIARNITERKQHEREREAIIAVSIALRHATTRTEILSVILDQLINLFDADGATLVLPDPQSGGFIDEMGRGAVGERMIGLNIPPGKGVCNWVVTNKKPYLNNHAENDPFFYRPDLLGDSHCIASVPLITQDQVIGALWIARKIDILEQDLRLLNAIADIAANAIRRVILYEQTEHQLHHLLALHQIDIAISNNFDSAVTLNVILSKVKGELEVDAVSILLLDPATRTLDYAAGIGFRTRGIEQSHVGLGDGCAGCAAKECRTVSCLDIGHADGAFIRSSLLAGEEFVSHYATPLVVKGEVKGVLELFHRNAFEPEKEWLDYYETIATQAAIAIENASLLENLQRSNAELTQAYDATIEGWSRALDLRDKETEGHTQRVAHMALELAEKMGMDNTEKQDLWRGSLLHDIGKMGVPDSILLKPGPLTDSEREIMQQHPVYAYQMLFPIPYLKHALEVPYCHHEKWDGSGYPRGLKGDEIPLFARVFAVVDVYDALTSDRPYREAWTPEKAYRYIQEQAGRHFDLQVVKAFLDSKSR